MASKHAAGTPVTGEYSNFTAEQLRTLEEIKDRSYALGIAPAKYANHVLLPDGKIVKETSALASAAKAAHKEALSGDLADPAVLIRASVAAAKVQEITDALAQERFLFVVNADGLPVVYFQCATSDNPDLPRKATAKDKESLAQVDVRMRELIDKHLPSAAPAKAPAPKSKRAAKSASKRAAKSAEE